MIDGSITHQYFSRSNLRKFEQAFPYCQINSNQNANYVCNNYIEINQSAEPRLKEHLIRSPEIDANKPTITKMEFDKRCFVSFYTDLVKRSKKCQIEYFAKRHKVSDWSYDTSFHKWLFLNLVNMKQSPLEIYSQIYFIIKDSLFSYLSYQNCITRDEYHLKCLQMIEQDKEGRGITFSKEERDGIYDVFLLYEDYKRANNLFNIQDIVNHLIRQIRIEFPIDVKLIDYILIDDIEELTENQLFLFSHVARYPIAFAGDTLQTISNPACPRIKDLKGVFDYLQQVIPGYPPVKGEIMVLNHRLNGSMVNLASFSLMLMKTFFSNTIDQLAGDYTLKLTPYVPTVLSDLDSLVNDIIIKEGNLNMKCNHCFICRTIQ